MIKYLYLAIFLLLGGIIKGQTIEGTVYHENETVPFANVLLRKASNPDLVYQFASTDDKGYYIIQLETAADSIWIEVRSMSFEPQKKLIKNIAKGEKHIENFNLQERTTELKEVIIEKELPITVKNDTTTYNPEAFKDGTERVVEDLLKKLPGIKVDESGEIKFKGKSIKKILLDGDDLFNSQYTIGSKNINVNIVDKVQAIENFNENALLKGLTNSDDVVLNLQLKKGKADLSGDASIGYGYNERYNSRLTGLLVSKKAKGFLTAAYNNVGNNYSPYNFRSSIVKAETENGQNLEAHELIMQGDFYSQIDDKYHRINNNLYSNANFLYKFSPKLTGKINLGVYDDKLRRTNKAFTEYSIGDDHFEVNQVESIIKKPRLYNASAQFSQTFKDSLAWEYMGKLNYHEVDFRNQSINNEIIQQNSIKTINFFTKHDLNLTGRINKNSAITANGLFSKSRAPQKFLLSPGLNIEEDYAGDILKNDQYSRFDKQVISLKGEYYLKINSLNLKMAGSYTGVDNEFKSGLTATHPDGSLFTDPVYTNELVYKYRLPAVTAGLGYLYNKKLGIGASVGVQHYDFTLNDKIRDKYNKENNWVLAPSFKVLYVFNRKANMLASYSYSEVAPAETSLFEGVVLTGYRNFRNNEPNFQFLKTHTYNINYGYNDFFNLTRFSLMFTHNDRRNNYFYKNIINVENAISTAFFANVGNRDYNIYLDSEKYFHFLRTTVQMNASYTLSFDKNIINNSDLRDVQLRYFTLGLTMRTGFKNKIDFENKLDYFTSEYSLESIGQNNFSSLTDAFKVIYSPAGNIKTNAVLNFVSPNLSGNNNYWFLDAEVRLTSKNKKIDYILSGRNLTNNTKFQSVNISDYSKTVSSHNLLERYILFSVDFRF